MNFLLEFWEAIPAMLMMYFVFILMREHLLKYAFWLIMLIILFILLKFRILPWEDWSEPNRFLWGLYNTGRILFSIILFTSFLQYGNNYNHNRKN